MVEANPGASEERKEEVTELTEEQKAEELQKAIEATFGIPIEQTPVTQLHVENVMAKARIIPMRNLA